MDTSRDTRIDKSQASLILGALGDTLGAPVEFMKHDAITAKYGPQGIQTLDSAYGVKGAITDDTQMSLVAADRLVAAHKRGAERGILGEYWKYTMIGYLAWLQTQGYSNQYFQDPLDPYEDKQLFDIIQAQGSRGPGTTCLTSLSAAKEIVFAQNDSKGCGTVMRVAPIGIFFGNFTHDTNPISLQTIYTEAANDAAITHGNPTAHHASGFLAVVIALSLRGQHLEVAIKTALDHFGTPDISTGVNEALRMSHEMPSTDSLQSLGEGWVAEEALAIALYCSLLCVNGTLSVEDALRFAVNHNGDSDSTGAITGNLIGVSLGTASIPQLLIGTDTEVSSLIELLRHYGEALITVRDYAPNYG